MENLLEETLVEGTLMDRFCFKRFLFFVEREHPTENLVKSILCSHSVKNKKVNFKKVFHGILDGNPLPYMLIIYL